MDMFVVLPFDVCTWVAIIHIFPYERDSEKENVGIAVSDNRCLAGTLFRSKESHTGGFTKI